MWHLFHGALCKVLCICIALAALHYVSAVPLHSTTQRTTRPCIYTALHNTALITTQRSSRHSVQHDTAQYDICRVAQGTARPHRTATACDDYVSRVPGTLSRDPRMFQVHSPVIRSCNLTCKSVMYPNYICSVCWNP